MTEVDYNTWQATSCFVWRITRYHLSKVCVLNCASKWVFVLQNGKIIFHIQFTYQLHLWIVCWLIHFYWSNLYRTLHKRTILCHLCDPKICVPFSFIAFLCCVLQFAVNFLRFGMVFSSKLTVDLAFQLQSTGLISNSFWDFFWLEKCTYRIAQ